MIIDVLTIAKAFLFVREAEGHKNLGRWVEAFQRIGGADRGTAWCMSFVSAVLGIAYQGTSPLAYTASCDNALTEGRKKGMKIEAWQVEPGDLAYVMASKNDATHVMFVAEVFQARGMFSSIEGNTNPEGGREGYGVFWRKGEYERPLTGNYEFHRYRDYVAPTP